jgi:pimeloyl-ACP methyl ester carboxylesterase
MKIRIYFLLTILSFLVINNSTEAQPDSIRVEYPYEVKYFPIEIEKQSLQMAYMDVQPSNYNGKNVILFHGKNFNGYYWKDVIQFLVEDGYRVIVPDQIGWGKSSIPDIQYSFHLLAENNNKLLEYLGITKVNVIGHSMGGMLAARFTLMYPNNVEKLIFENPIGFEDYRTFVPYMPLPELLQKELNATYESMKKYQMTYYPVWKPEYEQYVKAQAEQLYKPNYPEIALANALTTEMVYEQPLVYEFANITVPTLLIIGQADRTIIGKDKLSHEAQATHGQYPELGKKIASEIPNSKLVELDGVGHIPHVQKFQDFKKAVEEFLKEK